MDVFQILLKGGWLMLPLLIFSIWGLYIFAERILYFGKISKSGDLFKHGINSLLMEGDRERALNYCERSDVLPAEVIRYGLKIENISKEAALERIETAINRVVDRLQKPLGMLATISGIAPLTGFLGTVTGMIQAFMKIQELGGNVNAGVLAGGIWEALITTAVGLVIGIFAMVAYNYLKQKMNELISQIEEISRDALDSLL